MAKPWPRHLRVTLRDNDSGSTPLELPDRRMWPVGIAFAVLFAIFASVAGIMVAKASVQPVHDVFDLMMFLFSVFWILGWSVGVVILGALTALLLLYRESARLQAGCLVHVARLGPLKIVCEYELARMRNVRAENSGESGIARIRFDYEGLSCGIGDRMPRAQADNFIACLQRAGAGAASVVGAASAAAPANVRLEVPVRSLPAPRPEGASRAAVALIVANLLPIAGVLLFGWDLAAVMVLYWSESAVIGFYTILRMCIVEKLGAVMTVPFFLGHFGAFMAAHFAFVYGFFIHKGGALPTVGAFEELRSIFLPLWPAVAALVVSHGVSFFQNFIGEREYAGASTTALMAVPYRRIIVMHLTIIFGGWIVLALGTPAPALLVLVVMKMLVDLRAHRREHAARATLRLRNLQLPLG